MSGPSSSTPSSSLHSSFSRLLLDPSIMSPAELSPPSPTAPGEGDVTKGYKGRNMTLPASWWTSTSLFQLERRAIFAKVPTTYPSRILTDRPGYTQLTPLFSTNQVRTELSI